MSEWLMKNSRADIAKIARELNISEVSARIIVNRGMRTYNEARVFIKPELSALPSPFDITGMTAAVDSLLAHIEKGTKIAVYGDYDVDGVMSAVILLKSLEALSAEYVYYVPDRENEGYGLSAGGVLKLKKEGVGLIIACDNGISAIEEAELIYENGIGLIVIDHHEPVYDKEGKDILPRAEAVIDPKMQSCAYPFKHMCAAGLCYRFALALFERVKRPLAAKDDLLVFAAIATVCDIVELLGDNRIIVKNGLERVFDVENPGLKALINIYELKNVTAYHFGFILGPAINASGRLESAEIATRLFLTEDAMEARQIAGKLYDLNLCRRALTEQAYERLCGILEAQSEGAEKVCVIYDRDTHESVAGIVAGRIKERLNRPVIVITDSGSCAKGSARSVPGYNIFEALTEVSGLFIKYGGHSQAAGFSISHDNITKLREELNTRCKMSEEDFKRKLHIDMRMPVETVTIELCRELALLGPFGKGNKEPVFAEKAVKFKRIEFVGKDRNIVKLWVRGYPLNAICFDDCARFLAIAKEKTGTEDKLKLQTLSVFEMDIAFSVVLNEFRGESYIQLVLKDFR